MKSISTVFLVVAIWLAVLFGGQAEAWSWGPAMLAMAVSMVFSALSRPSGRGTWLLWSPIVLGAVWVVSVCARSAVVDFARADFMLLVMLLGVCWVVAGLGPSGRAVRLLHLGLALAVIANLAMAVVQWRHPEAMWPYSHRPTDQPTGFFSHYNYFSNFVIGSGLLLLGRVVFGDDRGWQRVVYGLAFVGTLVVVPLSGSRGGLMALGVGTFLFLVVAAVIGWRARKRWLPAVLVALPLAAIVGVVVGWGILGRIQQDRGQKEGVTSLADNSARLVWMTLALDVAADHPLTGGGSRSYSWERNGKWTMEDYGYGEVDEPYVHNELLQTVTDYGGIGALLVLATLLVFAGVTMTGLFLGDPDREAEPAADAVRAGVVAGGGALLLQANFSFVFHMLPSTMLLGLMFGLVLMLRRRDGEAPAAAKWLGRSGGVLLAGVCLVLGWKATRAFRLVWPVVYRQVPLATVSPDRAMNGLDRAAEEWPGYRLFLEKAKWARILAADPEIDADGKATWNQVAVEAYRKAFEFHPFNPEIAVNLGNACVDLGLDDEAEQRLRTAVELQGGLEAGFRARYFLALHLYQTWHRRWTEERRAAEALAGFLEARSLLEQADLRIPYVKRRESASLKDGVEEAIGFLEGAGVRPPQ